MSWKLESARTDKRICVKTFLMKVPTGIVMRTETTILNSDVHQGARPDQVSAALVFIPGADLKLEKNPDYDGHYQITSKGV